MAVMLKGLMEFCFDHSGVWCPCCSMRLVLSGLCFEASAVAQSCCFAAAMWAVQAQLHDSKLSPSVLMHQQTPPHDAALPALLPARECRQYSKQYVALEEQAHQAHKGVWQGDFQMPADWRKQQRAGSPAVAQQPLQLQASLPGTSRGGSQPPNPGCAIKGNISQSGEKGE